MTTSVSQYDELLAQTTRVLTEAARLTRPVLDRDEEASAAAGRPVWIETDRREPIDWAEFVTLALAGTAANIGGIEQVLAGRPGSWEADGVRQLLTSTVGHDQELLLEHRTEPVVVDLYVDEILVDLGAWKLYDEANQELDRRYTAIGIPSVTGVPGDAAFEAALAALPPATEEQERLADEIADLGERLEQQREADWASYGAALKAAVEAAAARREGLRVPVVVNVDLETFRGDRGDDGWYGLADQLREEGLNAIPLPGDGRPPLSRLEQLT